MEDGFYGGYRAPGGDPFLPRPIPTAPVPVPATMTATGTATGTPSINNRRLGE